MVQVADTGVDQNSCYFRDPNGNVAPTTISLAAFNAAKRKVIQYVAYVRDLL